MCDLTPITLYGKPFPTCESDPSGQGKDSKEDDARHPVEGPDGHDFILSIADRKSTCRWNEAPGLPDKRLLEK